MHAHPSSSTRLAALTSIVLVARGSDDDDAFPRHQRNRRDCPRIRIHRAGQRAGYRAGLERPDVRRGRFADGVQRPVRGARRTPIDDFTAETGIEVEVRYGDTPEMGAALLEEGGDTPADVFYSQDAGATGALAKADLLAELPDATMARVDERYRPSEGNAWVGVTGRARVIVYHPDLVDDLPEGVLDLVDPKYKDKVAWVPGNASFQAFVTALRVKLGEDGARSWLEDMKANGAKVYENNIEVLDAVNAGEVPIGLINHYYWAQHLAESGVVAEGQAHLPRGRRSRRPRQRQHRGHHHQRRRQPGGPAVRRLPAVRAGPDPLRHRDVRVPAGDGIPDPKGVPPLADLEGLDVDLNELDSLETTQALLTDLGSAELTRRT